MTNYDKILDAILVSLDGDFERHFSSKEIRIASGVRINSFGTTMKALKVGPGTAPKVPDRVSGTLIQHRKGVYSLSKKGVKLLTDKNFEENVLGELEEAKTIDAQGYWNNADGVDERSKILREIAQRQGQPVFRRRLLRFFKSRCVVSKCNAVEALEAAHIEPYLGVKSNEVWNGIILRADIHTLFDLNIMAICPITQKISVSPSLIGTCYENFEGMEIDLPSIDLEEARKAAFTKRWDLFLKKRSLMA